MSNSNDAYRDTYTNPDAECPSDIGKRGTERPRANASRSIAPPS